MKRHLIRLFYVALMVAGLTFTSNAFAAINLSVTSLSGGGSLRLNRVSSSGSVEEDVKIRVISSDNQRYQIFQRFINPLVNGQNQSLGRGAFLSNTRVGSNATGTLYSNNPSELTFSDQLLYSSNGNGDGDSFTVSYNVDADRISHTGNFSGKILYTIRPLGGSAQQDVYLSVFFDATSDFKFEVESSTGGQLIEVAEQEIAIKNASAKISYQGNLGRSIKVYQEIDIYPQNELLNELNEGYVQLMTTGTADGSLNLPVLTDLNYRRVLLYSSTKNEDEFFVNFAINPEAKNIQNAGNFSGRIKYIVEVNGSEQEKYIDLNVVIKPVFKIDIQLPPDGMKFERVLPNDPPQIKEVGVTVTSNLGKPYSVAQSFAAPLANQDGQEIDRKYFTIKGELVGDSLGKIQYNDFQPFPQIGQDTIFYSDGVGSSAQFKIIYRLKPYQAVKAGNYSAAIVYSLGEI